MATATKHSEHNKSKATSEMIAKPETKRSTPKQNKVPPQTMVATENNE